MRILFVNTTNPVCGVHQYGENLAAVLSDNPELHVHYVKPDSEAGFRYEHMKFEPDVTLYNWQGLIGGWMGCAPFAGIGKQVLVYHDLGANFNAFNAVLFSDPTMRDHDNWYSIGRPLNYVPGIYSDGPGERPLRVGVHGFLGGGMEHALNKAQIDLPGPFTLRAHLPASPFVDPHGHAAATSMAICRSFVRSNVTLEVTTRFLSWHELVLWLSQNDINLYLRDHRIPFPGVSSALDAALCARRPIGINQCNGFRHLHDCSPSIKLEERTVQQILDSGLAPLLAKYEEYAPGRVSNRVREILSRL